MPSREHGGPAFRTRIDPAKPLPASPFVKIGDLDTRRFAALHAGASAGRTSAGGDAGIHGTTAGTLRVCHGLVRVG